MLPLFLTLALSAFAEDPPAAPPQESGMPAAEESAEKTEPWQRTGWGWGGLPYVIYNSDDGVNVGLIGSIYRYDGKTAPFRTRIGFLASFTSKGILYDYVDIDALGLAGGKLRLTTRFLFDSRFSEPFCGIGGDVVCDDAQAQMESYGIDLDAMTEEERTDALRRWYYAAYRQPYFLVWARWPLGETVELIGSYRLSYYTPFEKFPYTLYSSTYDLDDERGLSSVLQAGVMADTRDNEPSPFRGYWIEGTIRGGPTFWDGPPEFYFGFNTTLRGYLPLVSEGRLTLADRFVVDGIVGEASNMKELDWMGGYQMYNGLGGARSMRGVRADRYRGKVKILNQAELRWRTARFRPGKTVIDLYLQAFVDVGHVAAEWEDLGRSPLHAGEGLGIRLAFNQNFVLRGDFATSQAEGWGLSGLYLDVDNLW